MPIPVRLSSSSQRCRACAVGVVVAAVCPQRSRIVLAAADGLNSKVYCPAARDQCSTGRRWRARFARDRLDGLSDEPRPGRPRRIADARVPGVIIKTLDTNPPDATHWSTRAIAARDGHRAVNGVADLERLRLQPHREDASKLSPDPPRIEKFRDVVGLYLNPPEHALVLCVDETPQFQALERTAPILPMLPGRARARDARLQTPRHLKPLRRPGPRALARSSARLHSRHRAIEFKQVSGHDRSRGPGRPRRPRRRRQQQHPQDRRRSRTGSPLTRGSIKTWND